MELCPKMLEWYCSNETLVNFIIDIITIVGFITAIYAICDIIKYLRTRKMQNKINEMQRDEQTSHTLSRELEKYIGSGGHDYGVRLVFYKNYPYKLDDDGFRKYSYWYKFSEKHVPSGYISNTDVAIIEEVSFCGDRIYYNEKTHKWFIDGSNKQFKKYLELPYDMIIYRLPFQNILGYRFGSSDWTDKHEPVFFTKYKYNSWKLFGDNMTAVLRCQYGGFPSSQLILSKTKRIKRYKVLFHKMKTKYVCIKRKVKRL